MSQHVPGLFLFSNLQQYLIIRIFVHALEEQKEDVKKEKLTSDENVTS